MGSSIDGYIEIHSGGEGWEALIDVSQLIQINGQDDRDTAHVLFGIRRFRTLPDLGFRPVFKKTTLPADVSKKVGIESGVYEENTYEEGEIVKGFYYPYFDGFVVGWPEIKAINWKEQNLEDQPRRQFLSAKWQTVFDLMEVLANNRKEKNVRLIVWFT